MPDCKRRVISQNRSASREDRVRVFTKLVGEAEGFRGGKCRLSGRRNHRACSILFHPSGFHCDIRKPGSNPARKRSQDLLAALMNLRGSQLDVQPRFAKSLSSSAWNTRVWIIHSINHVTNGRGKNRVAAGGRSALMIARLESDQESMSLLQKPAIAQILKNFGLGMPRACSLVGLDAEDLTFSG